MEIKYLSIKNFKSIRHMEISDIQNASDSCWKE